MNAEKIVPEKIAAARLFLKAIAECSMFMQTQSMTLEAQRVKGKELDALAAPVALNMEDAVPDDDPRAIDEDDLFGDLDHAINDAVAALGDYVAALDTIEEVANELHKKLEPHDPTPPAPEPLEQVEMFNANVEVPDAPAGA